MMIRLTLAATVATGLVLMPAAVAKDAVKPATPKHKTHPTAKARNMAHKTTRDVSAPAGQSRTNAHPLGEPYTMQKDEMTR